MPTELTAAIILSALFILFLIPNFKIVKENEAIVVERLGSFLKVIDTPGIHFMIPLVDRVVQKESLLPMTKNFTYINDHINEVYAYTYTIKDIKMFCYAATEPVRMMEDKMKTCIKNNDFDQELIRIILLDFGVQLQKIEKMN